MTPGLLETSGRLAPAAALGGRNDRMVWRKGTTAVGVNYKGGKALRRTLSLSNAPLILRVRAGSDVGENVPKWPDNQMTR